MALKQNQQISNNHKCASPFDIFQKIRKLMRRKSSPSSRKGEKRSRSCYPEPSPTATASVLTATTIDNIPNKENQVMMSSTPILQKMQPKRTESSSKDNSNDGKGVIDRNWPKLRSRSSSTRNKSGGFPSFGSGGISSNNKTNRLIIEGMIDVRESKISSIQKFWFSLFTNEMLIARQLVAN